MYIRFLAICVLGLCMSMGAAMAGEPNPMTTIHSVAIPEHEIPELETNALDGDAEAALRLGLHFRMTQDNLKQALYWYTIAAENGSVVGQHNLGSVLGNDPDPKVRRRARYWLRRAAGAGNESALRLLQQLPSN